MHEPDPVPLPLHPMPRPAPPRSSVGPCCPYDHGGSGPSTCGINTMWVTGWRAWVWPNTASASRTTRLKAPISLPSPKRTTWSWESPGWDTGSTLRGHSDSCWMVPLDPSPLTTHLLDILNCNLRPPDLWSDSRPSL